MAPALGLFDIDIPVLGVLEIPIKIAVCIGWLLLAGPLISYLGRFAVCRAVVSFFYNTREHLVQNAKERERDAAGFLAESHSGLKEAQSNAEYLSNLLKELETDYRKGLLKRRKLEEHPKYQDSMTFWSSQFITNPDLFAKAPPVLVQNAKERQQQVAAYMAEIYSGFIRAESDPENPYEHMANLFMELENDYQKGLVERIRLEEHPKFEERMRHFLAKFIENPDDFDDAPFLDYERLSELAGWKFALVAAKIVERHTGQEVTNFPKPDIDK